MLRREILAARRAEGGAMDPNALVALANLALNLRRQGKLAEAEPLLREAVAARREVSGNDHQSTMKAAGSLGELLLEQGKLVEAEPLLVEVVAWSRKWEEGELERHLQRPPGRAAAGAGAAGRGGAGAGHAGGRPTRGGRAAGPGHPLEAEAVAARLRHAQPDGAAAAAAELRAVVGRMGEFLGAAHQ